MAVLRRFGLVLTLGFLASGALAQSPNAPSGNGAGLVNYTVSSPQFTPEFPSPTGFIPPGARRFGLMPDTPFLAEMHPRNGAILMGAYLDACNEHASAIVSMSLTSTDILGNNPMSVGGLTVPPMSGCVSSYVDLSGVGYVADDRNKHLIARVVLGSGDPLNSFASVRLLWDQAGFSYPTTPVFNDVPDTHPFFKYIQRFSQLGITGGCSAAPPLYCADGPVTRGQMAVFIIRALMQN
jgi:hypothetical protein